jgi:Uma2 family endonuclease
MAEPALRSLTFEDYLVAEEHGTIRHEFVGGQMWAMSGGTRRHNVVTGNAFAAVRTAALTHGRAAYVNDVKLRVGDDAYYPDVMVACLPNQSRMWETAPCLIVEVLSPSTASAERREKLRAYQSIESMLTYLIVDPETFDVAVHRRIGNCWASMNVGPGEHVGLPCPQMTLAIDDLFENLPD